MVAKHTAASYIATLTQSGIKLRFQMYAAGECGKIWKSMQTHGGASTGPNANANTASGSIHRAIGANVNVNANNFDVS